MNYINQKLGGGGVSGKGKGSEEGGSEIKENNEGVTEENKENIFNSHCKATITPVA
jgi:hypothetical protein